MGYGRCGVLHNGSNRASSGLHVTLSHHVLTAEYLDLAMVVAVSGVYCILKVKIKVKEELAQVCVRKGDGKAIWWEREDRKKR